MNHCMERAELVQVSNKNPNKVRDNNNSSKKNKKKEARMKKRKMLVQMTYNLNKTNKITTNNKQIVQ